MPSGSSKHVLTRELPGPVERAALFLVQEAGHDPGPAMAMAASLLGAKGLSPSVRHETRRWRHLTLTPHERDLLAHHCQARRVLAEGVLLALEGNDVRDGAVLSAHALCESRQAARPVGLSVGGGRASHDQVLSARTRLQRELSELDDVVEAAVEGGLSDDLARDDRTANPNPRVVHLQNRLNSLGYRVQPDGMFGPVTEENVKDLQGKSELDVTGVVDAATRDALRNGGKPSWQVNAPPGLVPGQDQPPVPTPEAAGEQDVNKETGNDAKQGAPLTATPGRAQGESDSDGKTPDEKKKKSMRRMRVSVDLGEAVGMERLRERLEEAHSERAQAIRDGSGLRIRKADAKIKVLQEAVLSAETRNNLNDSDFAIPRGRKYPIHDRSHAANALARVAQHGTDAEKRQVRAAVRRKYPDMPAVQEAEVEEADTKGDYPQGQLPSKCPTCGAPVRGSGVCQRGHSVKRLMEATERQLAEDGLLQEDWAKYDATRHGGTPAGRTFKGAYEAGTKGRYADWPKGKLRHYGIKGGGFGAEEWHHIDPSGNVTKAGSLNDLRGRLDSTPKPGGIAKHGEGGPYGPEIPEGGGRGLASAPKPGPHIKHGEGGPYGPEVPKGGGRGLASARKPGGIAKHGQGGPYGPEIPEGGGRGLASHAVYRGGAKPTPVPPAKSGTGKNKFLKGKKK